MHQHKSQQGAAMMFFILFFVLTSTALTFLLSRSIGSDLYIMSSLASSKQSYLTAESALEDTVFKIMNEYTVPSTSLFDNLSGVATTTISYDMSEDVYTIRSVAKVGRTSRVGVVELTSAAGSSFNYGLQTGNGGFNLVNSASIIGNAFSNGSVVGQGNSLITGDVISAGPAGIISRIRANGSSWSNTLEDSLIEGDAHYNVGSGNTINGTTHTPFTVIDPEPLPIPDDKIEEWKTHIQNTGTVIPASACSSGVYTIDSSTTIGNVKVECNLRIRKTGSSVVVTLTGPIWATGDISLEQGPVLRVSSSLGKRSVQMIADNPANRLTSSKITIANSTEFYGSGHPSSFIMMVSQNNSAETGGSENAIDIGQSSSGALILYSGRGKINIGNQIHLKTVTGYQIDIGNNSDIEYDSGLTSVLFTGGPGGGYVISDWYQE